MVDRVARSCSHPLSQAGVCVDCGADMEPRRPVAGWVEVTGTIGPRQFVLKSKKKRVVARVYYYGRDCWRWWIVGECEREAKTQDAAQLAAEDALRAVLVDAAAALGLRVVPS